MVQKIISRMKLPESIFRHLLGHGLAKKWSRWELFTCFDHVYNVFFSVLKSNESFILHCISKNSAIPTKLIVRKKSYFDHFSSLHTVLKFYMVYIKHFSEKLYSKTEEPKTVVTPSKQKCLERQNEIIRIFRPFCDLLAQGMRFRKHCSRKTLS